MAGNANQIARDSTQALAKFDSAFVDLIVLDVGLTRLSSRSISSPHEAASTARSIFAGRKGNHAMSPLVPLDKYNARPQSVTLKDSVGLLDSVMTFLGRFVAYPSQEAQIAHTLWTAHSHLMVAWESTPRMAFLSPEPGSGKTRALEITQLLVPRPVEAVNVPPAYLFRKVADDDGAPTILFDEIDTIFGPKARDNEEIRGLLNAGHRRGGLGRLNFPNDITVRIGCFAHGFIC